MLLVCYDAEMHEVFTRCRSLDLRLIDPDLLEISLFFVNCSRAFTVAALRAKLCGGNITDNRENPGGQARTIGQGPDSLPKGSFRTN